MATETLSLNHRKRPTIPQEHPLRTHTRGATLANGEPPMPSPSPNSEFTRSASYTYLPRAKDQYFGGPNVFAIKGSFSEDDLIAPQDDGNDGASPVSSGWTTPEEHDPNLYSDRVAAREVALDLQESAKITVQRLTGLANGADTSSKEASSNEKQSSIVSLSSVSSAKSGPRQRSSASTSNSRSLNRKSWYSVATTPESRSPSPHKKEPEPPVQDASSSTATTKRKSLMKRSRSVGHPETESVTPQTSERPKTASRRSSIFGKRPLSVILTGKGDDDTKANVPAVPTIPKSFSTDKLPSAFRSTSAADSTALPPQLGSQNRLNPPTPLSITRRKDELWSVFRYLDGDYVKFASKSVAFKANVVRSGLIPFLRNYADHASTYCLRPEDLDRRANILNKWWTGLIELLHGRNNQSISGTDRPVILDGISGIMDRPEWRLSPSPFCPLDRRMKGYRSPKNRSTTSLNSSASDFLADSVHHNVRNIFVQNLRAQMAFVVDKMSLRNASASLVTFCGKACAYAFMFVQGMADVLVRLWDLPTDTLRRVLAENGLSRFDSLKELSEEVTSRFPPCLHQLSFTSLAQYNRKLRTPPPLPTGTTNIQWWGYWLERWTGRESDLFYVFVKHYHILVTDFLPVGSTKKDRMCVPGLLLVHAQILTNLDATIHRQALSSPQDITSHAGSPTFDDVLADPDAVASTMPTPPLNATRLMAENRLIMLIRDFLSDRAAHFPAARQMFAESFNDMLQAAARGISVYDPAACYTLLDLLEEALVILVRYEHLSNGMGTLINSDFWQLVCRRMISSENTLTEIRLYAFLYTIWNSVVCDLGRRADLCMGLLLDPYIFTTRFNHWSPMVRAYYMRLLCWRIGRFDGQAAPGDSDILETLLERLQTTWSHYLWSREEALDNESLLPQTSPCNPAPCRRLLIVRTDAHIPTPASFTSFDSMTPPMVAPVNNRPRLSNRLSTMSTMAELETRVETPKLSEAEPQPSPVASVRQFFRSMIGGARNRSKSQSAAAARAREDMEDDVIGPPRQTDRPGLTRAATDELSTRQTFASQASRPAPETHRNYTFKFSLEYHSNIKQLPPLRLVPPRLPLPAQRYLSTCSVLPTSPHIMAVVEPSGVDKERVSYCGRALAEWALVVSECQSFFERRKNEGVPEDKSVETPTLGVEVFKRPG